MAYRSSRRKTRTYRNTRRSTGRRSTGRRYSVSNRGRAARRSAASGRGRGQTIKLVIQQAPALDPSAALPGVPGQVGVAALGAPKKGMF